MTAEDQIAKIAVEVETTCLIPDTIMMSNADMFVAINQNLCEATYVGRKEAFSWQKFRKHMRFAAAYCQVAAEADTKTILDERLRQDRIWGDEFDKKNTANDWHAYAAHYSAKALRVGEDYAQNMLKAAGICQAAMLQIDRYCSAAPRHYEDLSGAGARCLDCGDPEGKDHVCNE